MSRPKKEMVASMGAAVAAFRNGGVETSVAALQAAKNAGAPGFKSNGSVDLAPLRAWLKAQPPTPEGEETKASLEIRRLRAQCEKLEHDVAVSKGLHTPNDQIRADMLRIQAAQRAALQTLRADVPTWEGLSAPQMQVKMDERCEKICADLHSATSKLYQ